VTFKGGSAASKLQPKKILTYNAATAAATVATRDLEPVVAENVKTVTDTNFRCIHIFGHCLNVLTFPNASDKFEDEQRHYHYLKKVIGDIPGGFLEYFSLRLMSCSRIIKVV
ncbi:12162_t:CDS:2, partial [Entrophospora sp. SA101]